MGVRATTPNVNLTFAAKPGEAENSLSDLYFPPLSRLLRKPRTVNLRVYLTPVDIASMDFSIPIRLHNTRAGSTYLNDGYYYVNKIADYQKGYPTKVTLIALT